MAAIGPKLLAAERALISDLDGQGYSILGELLCPVAVSRLRKVTTLTMAEAPCPSASCSVRGAGVLELDRRQESPSRSPRGLGLGGQ